MRLYHTNDTGSCPSQDGQAGERLLKQRPKTTRMVRANAAPALWIESPGTLNPRRRQDCWTSTPRASRKTTAKQRPRAISIAPTTLLTVDGCDAPASPSFDGDIALVRSRNDSFEIVSRHRRSTRPYPSALWYREAPQCASPSYTVQRGMR